MEKTIDSDSWNFGEPVMELVKVSSRGLRGHDLHEFLKRASHAFADLSQIKLAEDEIPVHLIGIGSTEAYGPNRNGDGFKEATCREHHSTFVKHAFLYRNHKNKDPLKSYGRIKASAYNEEMRRIELLVAFNGTKEAAERNKGLVAEDFLERLHNGDDLGFSMACKVAYDVCSSCGHRARSRSEYCTEDTCVGPHGEKRGGCRENLTKVAWDGHIIHVENPKPQFFDMSILDAKPADRIAYGNKADYLTKSADYERTDPWKRLLVKCHST